MARNLFKFFFIFIVFAILTGCSKTLTCKKVGPCTCQLSSGDKVDLSPLDAKSGDAAFSDVSSGGNDQYSWNPCTPFTEGGCSDVAVCDIRQNVDSPELIEYFILGVQETSEFSFDEDNNLQLTYTYQVESSGSKRESFIQLLCEKGQTGVLTPLGEKPALGSGKYYFQFKSQHNCFPKQNVGTDGPALSVGTVVCIVLASTALLYVVLGALFQTVVKKSSGVERIPNVSFWKTFPFLVKDGVLFVFRRGRKSNYTRI